MHCSRRSKLVQQPCAKRALPSCKLHLRVRLSLTRSTRYGLAGSSNTTGDDQKKLDVLTNELFINMLKSSYTVYAMASEENENLIEVEVSKQVRQWERDRLLTTIVLGQVCDLLRSARRLIEHRLSRDVSESPWDRGHRSLFGSRQGSAPFSVYGRSPRTSTSPSIAFYRVANIYDAQAMPSTVRRACSCWPQTKVSMDSLLIP